MAPEMCHEVPYDFKIDVFSFGLLLYEMLAAEAVFPSDMTPHQVMWKVLTNVRPELPDWLDPFVGELIVACSSVEPAARSTFAEILEKLEANDFAILAGVNADEVRGFMS
jgi:serine/threonine protein kinase